MRIDIVNDVIPPVAVTAVEIFADPARTSQTIMGQPLQRILNYVMTGGGYLAAAMGWGGKYSDFLKKVAIASAPATLIGLYNSIAAPTTPATISRPISMRRVARYPGPASESPFQAVRLI